jgi:hypothetical protein
MVALSTNIKLPEDIFRANIINSINKLNSTINSDNSSAQFTTDIKNLQSSLSNLISELDKNKINLTNLTNKVSEIPIVNTDDLYADSKATINNLNTMINCLPSLVDYPQAKQYSRNYESRLQCLEVTKTYNPSQASISPNSFSPDTISSTFIQSEVQNLATKTYNLSTKIDTIIIALQRALILN